MSLKRLDAPRDHASARLTSTIVSLQAADAALDTRVDAIEADHVVLRLTPDVSPSIGEGLEILQAPSGDAPVLRPFSNGSSTDLDLRLFGLGTGVVRVNGTIPATAPDLAALDTRVDALEITPPAHAASHQNGGTDEISVAGLSGLLADAQTPLAHNQDASTVTTGTMATARLGSGTANATSQLMGDQTYKVRPLVVPFVATPTSGLTFSNLPAAVGFFGASSRSVMQIDLTGYTQCRLVANKQATAGSAGSKLGIYYRTAFSTTASDYSIAGTSAVEVSVDTTNTMLASSWIDLATSAKADVCVVILGHSGDGATSPTFGSITLHFR